MQNPTSYMSPLNWEIHHQQPTDNNVSKVLQHRYDNYNITKTSAISNDQVVKTVVSALEQSPTQDDTTRSIVLFGPELDAFTEIVRTAAAKNKGVTKDPARTQVLGNAQTVILFFTDPSPVPQPPLEGSNSPPTYLKPKSKDAENHVRRQVYLVATALEKKGLGTNIQHFGQIHKYIEPRWTIPKGWRLKYVLVAGGLKNEPTPTYRTLTNEDVQDKVKVYPSVSQLPRTETVEECPTPHPSTPGWFGKKKDRA